MTKEKEVIYIHDAVIDLIYEENGYTLFNISPWKSGAVCYNFTNMSYGFNYIMISPNDPSRISGMARNIKCNDWPSVKFREEKGTFLKVGKLIRALFPDKSQKEITELSQKVSLKLAGSRISGSLKISDKPSEIYCGSYEYKGNLGSSCMNEMGENLFEFYDSNPDIRILYLKNDEGDLVARALLHTNVRVYESDKTINLVDRIYTTSSNLEALFFKWAKDNGYYAKQYQNMEYKQELISPNGEDVTLSLSIDPGNYPYDACPYMDTFRYLCTCKNVLHNDSSRCYEDELCETVGTSERGIFAGGFDYICNDCGYGSNDDYEWIYIEGHGDVCSSCSCNYTFCEHCGNYFSDDNMNYVKLDGSVYEESICDDCLNYNYTECEECEGYFSDDNIEQDDGGSDLCKDCITNLGLVICDGCECYHDPNADCSCGYTEDEAEERKAA